MLDQPHGIPATLGLIEAEEHEQEDILDDHGGLLMQLLAPAPVAPPPPGAGVDAGMQTMHSDVERVVARVKQRHQERVPVDPCSDTPNGFVVSDCVRQTFQSTQDGPPVPPRAEAREPVQQVYVQYNLLPGRA